jgi:hypothetical protein
METEAMYEGRDVASMTPRIFDRTSCRMPDSGRQSMLAGAIWHGIASRADSTGSVYGRRLKEIKATLFLEKAYVRIV